MNIFDTLKTKTDIHGQPLTKAFRSDAVIDRQIDELIGIIKGVMADGIVHQGEVEFLLQWMESNRSALDKWPAKVIYPRLLAALADGVIDIDEEREIMDLLVAAIGGHPLAKDDHSQSNSTALPFTQPAPILDFPGKAFCFTGKFQSGTRRWCEDQTIMLGGSLTSAVTKKLHYLVIGEIGSRDWIHSTHGRKIEQAIEHNESGAKISIVSEQYWFEHLHPPC